jgi:hypothetical protein
MDPQITAALIGAGALLLTTIITAIVTLLVESKFNILDKIFASFFGGTAFKKTKIFSGRRELPTHRDSIEQASQEICLISIHAMNFIRANESILKGKLKSGCRLRILSLRELVNNKKVNPQIKDFEQFTCHSSVRQDIVASTTYTDAWVQNLEHGLRENIEIRYYENFPTVLLLLIDKSGDNGFAIVEPILPYLRVEERIAFRVCSFDNKNLMEHLSKSFEELWKRSGNSRSSQKIFRR